jgi:hypothetical protein
LEDVGRDGRIILKSLGRCGHRWEDNIKIAWKMWAQMEG